MPQAAALTQSPDATFLNGGNPRTEVAPEGNPPAALSHHALCPMPNGMKQLNDRSGIKFRSWTFTGKFSRPKSSAIAMLYW
ncbi:hypothetical protein VB735_03025 [Halotia wernerae UHCC 0503]|nr:hypothetical protein [Halotia wernerae UHCC 0503]